MKKQLLLAAVGLLFSGICFGQHSFNNCSAAFLNNKMVVDTYANTGKCRLTSAASGELTVQTVNLSKTESKGVCKLPFSVAVRDRETKTLLLVTKQKVKQIDVQKVLKKCKKGDRIVVMTHDAQYALPHNEIEVL